MGTALHTKALSFGCSGWVLGQRDYEAVCRPTFHAWLIDW